MKTMTNKEKYRLFCEQEKTIPIFSRAWWLDSVAGNDSWDVCLVENGEEILASMPYVKKKRYGFTLLSQPPLTQHLGPWIKISDAKYSTILSHQKAWMQSLIDQLPKYDYFNQNWHYSLTNWLPFYWRGFEQSTRYTYVIDDLSNLDKVYSNFDSSYRNKIRKASRIVTVKKDLNPLKFHTINEKTFSRQGICIPYSKDFFLKHDRSVEKQMCREIFYAIDSQGNIHSALYLIWDDRSSYVHMVGEDPEYRNSGAGILLIWEAIKFTAETLKLNIFDFEGSMIEPVERVRRDCGGAQKPYFTVTHKSSKLLCTLLCLDKALKT